MEDERRASKRFKLSRMTAYDLGREKYIRAKGLDISRGGMAFVSEEYVEVGVPVWLSFSIPEPDGSWHEMEAEGTIVNSSDFTQGCRFGVLITRMAPGDRADFDAFLDGLEEIDIKV